MGRETWVAERVREFAGLRGRRVVSWTGVEMAIREEGGDDGGPLFEDPAVACRQLLALDAALDDATVVNVGTYQDDAWFGLWLHRASAVSADHTGIFRARTLTDLPTGVIEEVTTVVDEGVVAEVLLHVAGRPVLLMAGEIHEDWSNPLRFARLDESVLVFTDPADAASVDWTPDRPG